MEEITRSKNAALNPTEHATTTGLCSALGVRSMGENAARAVISRMIRNRRRRLAQAAQPLPQASRRSRKRTKTIDKHFDLRNTKGRNASSACWGLGRCREERGGNLRGGGGGGRTLGMGTVGRGAGSGRASLGVGRGESEIGASAVVFKTVLSSMAKQKLRAGLKEIASNPHDLLRCGFLEIEPTKQGSTASGCHLASGWAEQRAGNERRVRRVFLRCVTIHRYASVFRKE